MQKKLNVIVINIVSLSLIFCVPVPLWADLVPDQTITTSPTIDPSTIIQDSTTQNNTTVPNLMPPTNTTDFLMQNNTLSAADAPCETAMCGVTSDQPVSGIIYVEPNLTLNPDVRKVAYYLNGTFSTREYTSPFTWGGSAGFDTTKLKDGIYTLSGAYTTKTGDKNFSLTFTVLNAGLADTIAPVISAVVSSNVTASSATISWTTDELSDSQVEYRVQGATPWTVTSANRDLTTNHSVGLTGLNAGTIYEYRVKSKDLMGNLATQTEISILTTSDATAPATGDFTGVTAGATVSGLVNIGPNLSVHPGIRKVAYYLNGTKSGKVYLSPFYWGGVNGSGTAGFDTSTIADGKYTLGMIYTTGTGDFTSSIKFTVNNTAIVQPKLTGITAGDTVQGIITVGPDLATFGVIQQAEYFVDGISKGVSTVSPFTWGGSQGFDTTALTNASHVLKAVVTDVSGPHEVNVDFIVNNQTTQFTLAGIRDGDTLTGVVTIGPDLATFGTIQKAEYFVDGLSRGISTASPFTWGGTGGFATRFLANTPHAFKAVITDDTGVHEITLNFISYNTDIPPSTDFVGVTNGATVNGVVNIGVNLSTHPDIRKVAYYLDFTQSGKVYSSPYLWGGINGDGTVGFDTRTLLNIPHILIMFYTDKTGDHEGRIDFIVNN